MTDYRAYLPEDVDRARLVGRAWIGPSADNPEAGPALITTDGTDVFVIPERPAFCADLLARPDVIDRVDAARRRGALCSLETLITNSLSGKGAVPYLLSPVDLQALKAAGVTFAISLIERLVEERAEGDPARAREIREDIARIVGPDLSKLKPGSTRAQELEAHLKADGMWSQYFEVGIGPYAEIFTKSQPLSSVGFGMEVGLHPDSSWNNPEPEVVLLVTPDQRIVGATLGNDVNLRDIEGRSALLLGRAKDNNASCALGPFIRLLDDAFTLDDVRTLDLALTVTGDDGFEMTGHSSMSEISRDPLDLVEQCAGAVHQYPDGFVLMTGTLFAPTQDRSEPDKGFTHSEGDTVQIRSSRLGALVNRVTRSDRAPPWEMGISALVRNLRARALL